MNLVWPFKSPVPIFHMLYMKWMNTIPRNLHGLSHDNEDIILDFEFKLGPQRGILSGKMERGLRNANLVFLAFILLKPQSKRMQKYFVLVETFVQRHVVLGSQDDNAELLKLKLNTKSFHLSQICHWLYIVNQNTQIDLHYRLLLHKFI